MGVKPDWVCSTYAVGDDVSDVLHVDRSWDSIDKDISRPSLLAASALPSDHLYLNRQRPLGALQHSAVSLVDPVSLLRAWAGALSPCLAGAFDFRAIRRGFRFPWAAWAAGPVDDQV